MKFPWDPLKFFQVEHYQIFPAQTCFPELGTCRHFVLTEWPLVFDTYYGAPEFSLPQPYGPLSSVIIRLHAYDRAPSVSNRTILGSSISMPTTFVVVTESLKAVFVILSDW